MTLEQAAELLTAIAAVEEAQAGAIYVIATKDGRVHIGQKAADSWDLYMHFDDAAKLAKEILNAVAAVKEAQGAKPRGDRHQSSQGA